jgi:acyl-coenzyme A synthetase/AMP-(fatty) acid ligase
MAAVIQAGSGRAQVGNAVSALVAGEAGRIIAFDARGQITVATFRAQVRAVAATLPQRPFALNLCADRYRFLVAFCAVASRGQASLLPPARTRAAIDEVRAQHPDSYCIGDGEACGCPGPLAPGHFLRLPDSLPEAGAGELVVADDALVAIGFTSGSTGAPRPNPKTWGAFRASTAQNLAALADLCPSAASFGIVATVPPQHMYGIELSVLMPLIGGAAVHAGKPFFPADVLAALNEAPAPRLLVTTPVHLRAMVHAAQSPDAAAPPPMAGIVSATAPLTSELAAEAEALFGCEVRELFGSTETCVIARRRTAHDDCWTPLPGVRVAAHAEGTLVTAAHLAGPVLLADVVEVEKDGCFRLLGRQADLLEIAGKRASLADLTRRLLAIPGVEDGVVFQCGDGADHVRRVAALVVAPTLDEATILGALREAVDPVFLPRPLRRVAALPRSETGKLPREDLLRMLQSSMC